MCAVAMATSTNINRLLKSVLFAKNMVVRFYLQFACNKHLTMLTSLHCFNNNLTERSLIIPC